ncbi:MAG TPA: DUF2520 domain-containing protein [Pedobacter sp.]|jgi:predicted short-subunit dehydrogenase-like oxidoreductase (DUF2520 family)
MKIVLLGSGNVATHLGIALKLANHEVIQVWSRTLDNARLLAKSLEATFTDNLSEVSPDADIYMASVSDDYIADIISAFAIPDKLLVHTSGSTGLDISGLSGVFYPLQTFTKTSSVDFSVIPIAIEGVNQEVETLLFELAESIGSKPLVLNSEQRKALHVAAVFACNFSNHLYSIANKILDNNDLNFELIRPLISETASKIQSHLPATVQTGPAVRNDQKILDNHLQFLADDSTLADLYDRLSQSIINFNQKA